MVLKDVHDKQDEIPEQYRELYTEKNGKWELTGITGVKTTADVDRVQKALTKERDEHKATKEKLGTWGDLKHEDVVKQLDRIPELEAAAAGKLDDEKIEAMVERRVEATIKSRTAPLERQIATMSKENETKTATLEQLTSEKRQRTVHDAVRKALTEAKVVPEAHEDALLLAERAFDVGEDGVVMTRQGAGFSEGLDAAAWLSEVQPKRPHWWPVSSGGGAGGGRGNGMPGGGANPWTADGWNMTKQGAYLREHGSEKASAMAKAAGTALGGGRPAAKKPV
jgi:hypothetical protein